MSKENREIIASIFRVIVPLIYLYFWYNIPVSIFGKDNLDVRALILSALPVIFIGVLSRQTSWSIGGDKGIKGDNIGRKARATIDRKGSFELDGLDIDKEKVEQIIKAVTDNPVYTDKKKQEG